MTLQELLRRPAGRDPVATHSTGTGGEATEPLLTSRHRGLAVAISLVLLAGILALIFGPARGMRNDIGHVSGDLNASRHGIFLQLDAARTQLGMAESSLKIQEQGLAVAVQTQKDTSSASQSTQDLLLQTREALQLVRDVTKALGPLDQLGKKVDSLATNVEQTVRLAQATLQVAQQTLNTGQQALAVAQDTLATLKRSEQLQVDLLETAKATLEQTRQINAKTPGVPVFPTGTATAAAR